MRTQSYPSDLADDQWPLIEPHLPVYPGGRPRTTNLRDVVDAIFYVLRTGCQWRYLPKDFPPKSTVWRYFDEWRHNGTLESIHDLLRCKVRSVEKPYSPRTTASVDSQSVDTTSGGEQRGRDNAKNVDGRKRHIVVDSPKTSEGFAAVRLVVLKKSELLQGFPVSKEVASLPNPEAPRRISSENHFHTLVPE
jgi:transposase